MSDASPDFNDLGRRYLDLWQRQVSLMAKDPATAGAMAQAIALLSKGLGGFAQADNVPATPAGATGSQGGSATRAACADASGPAPPGLAPDGQPADLGQLLNRIAVLEERVARLESELGRRRRRTGKRPSESGT